MNGPTLFRWLVLAAAAGAAVLLLGWLSGFVELPGSDPVPPPATGRSAPSTGSLAPAIGGTQPGAIVESAAATASGSDGRAADASAVRGRVIDRGSRGIGGARVWLTAGVRPSVRRQQRADFPGHGEYERAQAITDAVTGADGQFALPAVAKGSYTVFVEHSQHPAFVRDDLVIAGAVDDLVLVLEPGAAIRGAVVGVPAGTSGLMVAAVAIEPGDDPRTAASIAATGDHSVPVGGNGAFALEGLRPGRTYRVHAAWEVRPSTFRIGSRAVDAPAGTVGLVLTWDDGMRVTARLQAAGSGAAVAQGTAEYRCDGGSARPAAVASAAVRDGRLELGPFWPAPGQTLDVAVTAPGFAPWSRSAIVLAPAADLDLGTIVLQPVPVARVAVLASDGKPVAGATVEMRSVSPAAPPQTARTGTDGRCAFHLTAEATVVFVARARGVASAELGPLQLPALGDSSHELHLSAGPAPDLPASLHGTLRANGSPLAGARIAVDAEGDLRGRPRAAITGADGSFRLQRAPAGSVQLLIDHRDFATEIRRTVELQAGDNAADIDVVLAAVRGRVVDVAGQAVVGASVRLVASAGQKQRLVAARTDELGAFAFPGVAADGGQQLEIDAPGHVPVREPIANGDGERLIVLRASGGMAISATNVAGAVAARAQPLDRGAGAAATAGRSAALVGGQARIDGLSPGRWRVELVGSAGEVVAAGEVTVASGQIAAAPF